MFPAQREGWGRAGGAPAGGHGWLARALQATRRRGGHGSWFTPLSLCSMEVPMCPSRGRLVCPGAAGTSRASDRLTVSLSPSPTRLIHQGCSGHRPTKETSSVQSVGSASSSPATSGPTCGHTQVPGCPSVLPHVPGGTGAAACPLGHEGV